MKKLIFSEDDKEKIEIARKDSGGTCGEVR